MAKELLLGPMSSSLCRPRAPVETLRRVPGSYQIRVLGWGEVLVQGHRMAVWRDTHAVSTLCLCHVVSHSKVW